MVRHIVFYKFRNESDLAEAEKMLLSMKGKIDLIREVEVGRDFIKSPRSFQLALMVVLDSREALDAYQNDEYHVNTVKKLMHSVVEQAASVDYEF